MNCIISLKSFNNPTAPIVGVGKIALPSVSLYSETFPDTIGMSRIKTASAIPLMQPTN